MRYGPLLLTLLLALPSAARAALPDPGWDEARCGRLTIATGHTSGQPGDRRIDNLRATLATVGAPDDIASHLRASALRTDGPASLDTLPSLFAGGLLVAAEHDRPHQCDLLHAFRRSAEDAASLPEGAQADQRWTGLRVETRGATYDAATLHLHAENDQGGITRISEEATGLSSAGNDMTATPIAHASIKVSMPHARLVSLANGHPLAPDDVVTVERLVLSSDDTRVEASGEIRPAARAGRMTVHAENMEGIKDALPVADRTRAGAAFLIMRLAAKQEPDGTLGWEIVWDDDGVTINGVSLPMHF